MVGKTIIFDFDRTIIDDDSDRWVVVQMGLTSLFNQLRPTLTWTSLMNRMVEELHSNGKTVKDIAECLKQVPLHPRIVAVIKSAHSIGCDLRVLSDANQFYIETILKHHGLFDLFSEIITNPTFVDEQGRLMITPYHDSSNPHSCSLCPPNMCKGLVMERIQAAFSNKENYMYIYLGDGKGDYCPTLKLGEGDHVMPRKNFPLSKLICSNPTLVKARVHDWNDGDELEAILLRLIDAKSSSLSSSSDTKH